MEATTRRRAPALLAACGLAVVIAGCTDRPPLDGPVPALIGPYQLDTGDRLRIVVYDQPSLTNLYQVNQSGEVAVPLIGDVAARHATTDQLAQRIEAKLSTAYLRDPNVTVEVATYRPFFALGEVGAPGEYTYVPGMTAETAIAKAGGYTDRANRRAVRISRTIDGALWEDVIPVTEPIRPGDTIYVPESLF